MNDETAALQAAMENPEVPIEKWTQSQVSSWLNTLGVKKEYIDKLYKEEVDGRILLQLTEDFLERKICMKSGPAFFIIKERNKLVDTRQSFKDRDEALGCQKNRKGKGNKKDRQTSSHPVLENEDIAERNKQQYSQEEQPAQESSACVLTAKKDCKPRPFEKEGIGFTYIKHNVLQPESGAFDLITPCHEYKSFSIAATLDRTRLQAKFAKELLKFATGCLNIRSNGTIHFGVMDSIDDTGYVHGEIIGLPINEKDMYTDALDYIGRSFTSDSEQVGLCIRPPQFIEVMDMTSTDKRYVVEVDIVPSISLVKNKVFSVRLPNFKESTNKVEFEKATIYRRTGSKTETIIEKDLNDFYQRVRDRDAQREKAEHCRFTNAPDTCQDLGRKLRMLITNGKKFIEKDKWYILVTNKFKPDDLRSIDFLINMNIFCVFDFDPDSKSSGFCRKYTQHHAANPHFMQNYKIQSGMSTSEFVNHLHLFEQTSWIFCNGCSDYKGKENPCDEMSWIKSKLTLLKESVSLICKRILPKGTFQVIFLLTSQVEKPLLHTFYEFFTDMEGHDDIICICESEENFHKLQSFADGLCATESVNRSSVVGMKMSHVDATLQQIQPVTSSASKHLPTFLKGQCLLEMRGVERMYSLEILSIDHCEETSAEFIEAEKERIEQQFYRGGRVTWLHFWLAEKMYVGEVIKRDAFKETSDLLTNAIKCKMDQRPVKTVNIFHHPGSGGSTVARQVLWYKRKVLRCAYVKPSYSVVTVTKHAVQLREYEEKDPQKCLPVLLLIDDCDKEYLDNLKNELEVDINTKKLNKKTLCFILISCRRSNDPEKMCKHSSCQNVSITHKLSKDEKRNLAGKRKNFKHCEFLLTLVLMSEEFNPQYVEKFVQHLLKDIDHKSVVTRVLHYVALLNTYVQNSFISQSHCEAVMALTIPMDRFRKHMFETSLSDQAKLVFIHLRDDKTHIESIRIIHPLVAKEILVQLLGAQEKLSELAMKLLRENVLFEHRFGEDEFRAFLRTLFIRRSRISKGGVSNSSFSPLIEHVREQETPERAIELLEEAYNRLNKDAFFAQQLARLNYTHERFEDAKHWAELAAKQMPNNSYILDTKGHVYGKWFNAKVKSIDKHPTAESTADAVEMALKAMECFKECQQAAISDHETMNQSGFFSAVEVGCGLLKLIFSLQVFSTNGHSEGLKYLLTEKYIPEEIRTPWNLFHPQLKNLQKTLYEALEWISDDLNFFQTKIMAEDEEEAERPELKMSRPWLVQKSSEYGKYFSQASINMALGQVQSTPASLTPLLKRMMIYDLGGGNITSILSIMTDKKKDAVETLEHILALYPSNPLKARLNENDLVTYIITNVALRSLSPQSRKVAALKDLQKCLQFLTAQQKCQPSALFLQTLLFWPEDKDPDNEKETKYDIVQTAVVNLQGSYKSKMKNIPQRKKRIYTHFYLSDGRGLDKFVHKSKVETFNKTLSVSERRLKRQSGEVWKMPESEKRCKLVSGWTEDETVYLEGPQKKKFPIHALDGDSVPYGNENITFYLGFTFRGPVAYNIQVKE